MRRTYYLGTASALMLGLSAISAPAKADMTVKLEEVASGLNQPLGLVQPAGDDRRFIIQQPGQVRILTKDGELLDEPYLDIRNKIVHLLSDFDERGMIGIAFHPDFAHNHKFYVAYSTYLNGHGNPGLQLWWDHTNVVAEYTQSKENPNLADVTSEHIMTAIDWPQFNHNGHWLGFGPDGMLYISTGDGGYANDWGIGHNVADGNGQDLTDLHGKMLRIDVNSPSEGRNYGIPKDNPFVSDQQAKPEIYALGLRNPWRCSFDMGGDHQLFCGNVGQNSFELVVAITKGSNSGWRRMEGSHCFDLMAPNDHPAQCDQSGITLPVLEYKNCTAKPQGCEGISITGGYVYRGPVKDWDGKYFFGDWSKTFGTMNGQLFVATKGSDGKWTMEHVAVANMQGPLPYVLAFGQDCGR